MPVCGPGSFKQGLGGCTPEERRKEGEGEGHECYRTVLKIPLPCILYLEARAGENNGGKVFISRQPHAEGRR